MHYNLQEKLTNQESYIPETLIPNTIMRTKFYNQDTYIGYTDYETTLYQEEESGKYYIFLAKIFVNKEYRNQKYGTEMFIKTMRAIHKQYPSITIVRWHIDPEGEFDSVESLLAAKERLKKFYKKLGATIDEDDSAIFFLKNNNYF